jgi:mycofactocin precursor
MAHESLVSTGEPRGALDADGHDGGELVDADLLVEEVSIDGMCGVY